MNRIKKIEKIREGIYQEGYYGEIIPIGYQPTVGDVANKFNELIDALKNDIYPRRNEK